MRRHNFLKPIVTLTVALAALSVFAPARVHAGLVPSGESIEAELSRSGSATLEKGGKYEIGTIRPKDGWTIEATGATIYCNGPLVINPITAVNYKSLNGFSINGGKWLTDSSDGIHNSLIKCTHAQNLKFTNMTIKACNVENHSIELVACKNAVIKGCNISGLGKPRKTSVEEAIQIDVATPSTAPYIAEFSSNSKLYNGAGCQNITVDKCTVSGGRAVCANFLNSSKGSDKKYMKAGNHHSNLKVKNCKLTGLSSEALALFNTMSAEVKNNTIKSKSSRKTDSHSVGLHFAMFYPGTAKQTKSSKITISGNKVYGGRQGLFICSHSNAKYGKVTVKNNKFYSKLGKKNAFQYSYVQTMKKSKNTLGSW